MLIPESCVESFRHKRGNDQASCLERPRFDADHANAQSMERKVLPSFACPLCNNYIHHAPSHHTLCSGSFSSRTSDASISRGFLQWSNTDFGGVKVEILEIP